MGKQLCFVASCVVVLGFTCSEAALLMEVSPRYLDVHRTETLVANCSFNYDDPVSSMSSLLSLAISKHNDSDSSFQNLALMDTITNPGSVHIETHRSGAQLFGEIASNAILFMGLLWKNPGQNVSGLYKCEANVNDYLDKPMNISQTSVLTAESLDAGQLLETIQNQKTQIANILKTLLSINDLVKQATSIESSLNKFTSYVETSLIGIESRLNALQNMV